MNLNDLFTKNRTVTESQLNEVDPRNFDSDEDYYDAVRNQGKKQFSGDWDVWDEIASIENQIKYADSEALRYQLHKQIDQLKRDAGIEDEEDEYEREYDADIRARKGVAEAGEWTRTPSGDYINMHTGVRSSSMPKKSKPRVGNRMSDMTVGSPKIVHKNGRAVGEIGLDHDPSPGQGPYYMKHYETNTWYSGYATKKEALADLKHVVDQMNEQGVAEASIPYALSAANYNAEFERQHKNRTSSMPAGGGYRGRVELHVESREDYLATGRALKKAAEAVGQHIEYGLSGGVMKVFSDSMTTDELDNFIDDTLEQGVDEGIGADTAKLGGIAALGIAGGLAGNYADQQQPKVEIGGKIAFVEPAHSRVPDSAMTLTGKDGKTYRVWATKGTVQSPQRYHAVPVQDVKEGGQKPGEDYIDPPEADYGDDYQAMVSRVKKLAGLGPMKTVYDPSKRVYRNMPTATQPKTQPKK